MQEPCFGARTNRMNHNFPSPSWIIFKPSTPESAGKRKKKKKEGIIFSTFSIRFTMNRFRCEKNQQKTGERKEDIKNGRKIYNWLLLIQLQAGMSAGIALFFFPNSPGNRTCFCCVCTRRRHIIKLNDNVPGPRIEPSTISNRDQTKWLPVFLNKTQQDYEFYFQSLSFNRLMRGKSSVPWNVSLLYGLLPFWIDNCRACCLSVCVCDVFEAHVGRAISHYRLLN